ncbi:MAG: DUF1641 domain-containing protein [Bacteroidales bacterium]|nr:DUF1641 domain-containing protein [Bacteroidales bacterium]
MAENNQDLQTQINDINRKLDLVLHHVDQQRLKRESVEDLLDDMSIVGKDAFQSTVSELDKRDIELNVDDLKCLSLRFLRNIDNFSQMLSTFESVMDFVKDAEPIANEVGVDVIHKLHDLEQKGYFDFIREIIRSFDTIVTNYSREDLRQLADNIPVIMETMKNLTDPEMLKALNNAVNTYKEMDTDQVKEYSLWKTFKEMRSPEMKRNMGFMMMFLKNLSQKQQTNNNA